MRNSLLKVLCTAALIASPASFAQEAAVNASTNTLNTLTAPAHRLPVARNGEIIDSVGGGATEAIINGVQTSNGISYITGGVGDEELAEINSQMHNYNTRLLLSSKSGEYMGEVSLTITDKKGEEVLSVDSAGPYFLTNLPAGSYEVVATSAKGNVKKGKLNALSNTSGNGKTVIVFNE